MDRKELMGMFNKQPRIGTLSTADKDGNVNVAVFGSPLMIDENTVVMGCGNNRTLKNLKENAKAAFIFMEPGPAATDWKGARVYLEATSIEESGPFYEQIVDGIAKVTGEVARTMIVAAVGFRITDVRPLLAPGG